MSSNGGGGMMDIFLNLKPLAPIHHKLWFPEKKLFLLHKNAQLFPDILEAASRKKHKFS